MRYLNARVPAVGEDRKVYSTVDSSASAGQTIFNVSYDQGRVAVFLNGIRLVPVQDYTYTLSGIGSNITLASGIVANDYLELIGLQGINAGNAVTEDNFVVGTASTGSGGSYTNSTTVFPVSSSAGDLVSVWRNGIKLVPTTDFTVNATASTVTLQSASNTADEITVHVVGILQHSNFVQTTGGTFTGTVAHTGTLNVSGGTLTTSTAQKTAIVDGGKGNLAKSDVGLGNVDNESKATMFTSPTFTGTPTVSSSSASYSPILDINNSNTGAYGGILKFTAKAGSTTYTPAQVRAYGATGASDGVLAIETAGAERFRIDKDGNVGINKTPTGTDKLQVKGVISSEASNSTNKWLAYTYTDNSYRLNYNGAGDDEIIITADGYVRKTNHPFFCGRGNQSNANITGNFNAIVFASSNITNNAITQNASTGKCSVPVAGKYMVNWTVGNQGSGNNTSYVGLYIFKNNGIEVSGWSVASGYDHTTHCQVILNLSSSDTVAFTYRTDYGAVSYTHLTLPTTPYV